MATVNNWNVFGVLLDLTATAGTVTRTSATQFKVNINASWKTDGTNYGMQVTSGGQTIYIPAYDGKVHTSGSGTLTGTYSISGNGAQTKSITVTFKAYKTDVSTNASKSTNITLSVSVPAWTSYKVTYNANGGSGAPSAQTKWKDQTLVLSSTKPTRTGHSFSKWNTASGGTGTSYSPGGNYTANANATLYAQWKANTYPVKYDANGGTLGNIKSQTKTYGVALTLTGTATRLNYNFLGWATSASATTPTYAINSKYTANAAVTLYAVWELAYSKPRITNLSVARCDAYENVTDDGTFALVSFDWACDKNIQNIDIAVYDLSGNEVDAYYPFMYEDHPVGTSGSCSYRIGSEYYDEEGNVTGNLETDSSYSVKVFIHDWTKESANSYADCTFGRTVTLNGLVFPIDFSAELVDGKPVFGVAFGKPAETENLLDIAFVTRPAGGFEYPTLEPGTDLNEVRTPNIYIGMNTSDETANYINCPLASGTFTLEVMSSGTNGQVLQRLTRCHKTEATIYERWYYTNSWGDWFGGWQTAELGSGFENYYSSGAEAPKYRRDGNMVEIRGTVKPTGEITYSTDYTTIFTLPEGYRPNSSVFTLCQGSGNCLWLMQVNNEGRVGLTRYRNGDASTNVGTSVWLPFSCAFLVG